MSEHRWSRLRCSPLRLTTAAVFGSIDCALQFHSASSTTPPRRYGCRSVPPRHLRSVAARGAPLHLRLQTIFDGYALAFPRHRSCVTVSGAYVCTCGHKLSLTAALSLTPTPPAEPTVSARFRSAVNPMPPLAIPSRRCRSASFLPPIARMPYCQPRSSHPQRKKPPTFQAPGISLFFVCDAMPTPGPDARCADAQTPLRLSANHFTHSEFAYGLGQGQVGLLSAGQAPQQKACRSVPPRHLPLL